MKTKITSVEMRQRLGELHKRMTEINDAAGLAALDAEAQANWAAAATEVTGLKERIKEQEFLEGLGTELNSIPHGEQRDLRTLPGAGENHEQRTQEQADAEYSAAFFRFIRRHPDEPLDRDDFQVLRRGMNKVDRTGMAERRDMSAVSLTGGGYLVPPEMLQPLEKALLFFGGMRQVSTMVPTISGADLPFPTVNDTGNTGRRLAENTTVTNTDVAVGVRVMKAYIYSSDMVPISYALMNDAPNLAGILGGLLGERIGRIQNTEFTNYAGADGPQGIIQATTLGVTAVATGSVTMDELINLVSSVDIAYRTSDAKWMMHNNTWIAITQLKNGEGEYFLRPDVSGAVPLRLLGYDVVINNDMATMATGVIPIVFGQLSRYHIREVQGVELIRLNERFADKGQVAFLAWARADGALIDAGAHPVKHLIMA